MSGITPLEARAIWARYAEQSGDDGGLSEALTVRFSERQAGAVARAAESEGRSRGSVIRRAVDVFALAEEWLAAEGVDVAREMASVAARHEGDAHRARAAADAAVSLAIDLKLAERSLLAEARGYNEGATGFTAATLREAQERADHLTAALAEACCDDPELIRAARRAAA